MRERRCFTSCGLICWMQLSACEAAAAGLRKGNREAFPCHSRSARVGPGRRQALLSDTALILSYSCGFCSPNEEMLFLRKYFLM